MSQTDRRKKMLDQKIPDINNVSPIIFNPQTMTLSVAAPVDPNQEYNGSTVVGDYDLILTLSHRRGVINHGVLDRSANPDRWGEDLEIGEGTALECRPLTLQQANSWIKRCDPSHPPLKRDQVFANGVIPLTYGDLENRRVEIKANLTLS